MALCSFADAKGLPVFTRAGQLVGRVSGMVLDTEHGSIFQMEVRPAGLVQGLVSEHLLIRWNQIIQWREDRIIVRDTTVLEGTPAPASSVVPSV